MTTTYAVCRYIYAGCRYNFIFFCASCILDIPSSFGDHVRLSRIRVSMSSSCTASSSTYIVKRLKFIQIYDM